MPGTPTKDDTLDLADRLALLGLDAADRDRLRQMKPVIAEALGPALSAFFERICKHPELGRLFSDDAAMRSAEGMQNSHWLRIADADFGPDYVAAVRRVGRVHATIGLEPRAYIGGYGVVMDRLIRQMIATRLRSGFGFGRARADELGADLSALVRAALLDIELSTSLYLENIEAARLRAEAAQNEAFAALSDALGRLADGDLAVRIDSEVGEKTRFNATVAALAETIEAVLDGARAIDGSAQEIAAASDDLSRRTEQQAASLEQTAAALEQLTGNVRTAAERADAARRQVAAAQRIAETGGRAMTDTKGAIDRIETSSKQVGQIVTLIDEIAFQTNLLALNAGVEAARAGEAGRGFAVVATEVRQLAQRASEAAHRIRDLIVQSDDHVAQGVSRVEETAAALQQIVGTFADVAAAVAEMASVGEAQSTAISEINAAVGELDQVAQNNAAMVEENTAAANSLRTEAGRLAERVGHFRVGSAAPPRRLHAAE